MNYESIYNKIIAKAKSENRSKADDAYYEVHHIIPTCLGGTGERHLCKNNRSHPNLVLLTAREHFFCHLLLCRIYETKGNDRRVYYKMLAAFNRMSNTERYQDPFVLSSRDYAKRKNDFKRLNKELQGKKVICLNTMKIYPSLRDVEDKIGIQHNHISESCRHEERMCNKQFWSFYDPTKNEVFYKDLLEKRKALVAEKRRQLSEKKRQLCLQSKMWERRKCKK